MRSPLIYKLKYLPTSKTGIEETSLISTWLTLTKISLISGAVTRMGHSPFQQGPSGVQLRKMIYAVLLRAWEQGYIKGVQCTIKVQYYLDDILVSVVKTDPEQNSRNKGSKKGL